MIDGVVKEIFENVYSLSIDFPLIAPPARMPHIYFALDISGSMSGSKIELAKESVLSLCDEFEAAGLTFTLIAFDDKVTLKDTRVVGYAGMREFCHALGPAGGTRFINVFASLKDEISKNKDSSTGILWLTDGCDNDGLAVLEPCMEGFKKWILEQKLLTAIHAIGLGNDHDAPLLMKLIKFGTQEGTFQYAADSEEIVAAVQRLKGLLNVSGGWGYVKAGANQYMISMPFQKNEKMLQGSVFVKGEDLKAPMTLELFMEGELKAYHINQVASKDAVTPKLFNAFAREQLRQVIEALHKGGMTPAQKADFMKIIVAINAKALTMTKEIQSQSEETKKVLMPYCSSITTLSAELMTLLMANLQNVISNEHLARLNHLVFSGILGGKIAGKVNKYLVEGTAFTKACKLVDKFGIADIPESERGLTEGQFEIRVGAKGVCKGLGVSAAVFSKGKELKSLHEEFGAPLGIEATAPFMVVAFLKKSPVAVKEKLEEVIEAGWVIGAGLSPAADAINKMIEKKYHENDKKVFMLVSYSPEGKAQVTPLIEKLGAQPALKIENQGAKAYLELHCNLEDFATSPKPAYELLMDGGCIGWKSSLLAKLGDILDKVVEKIVPHVSSIFPFVRHFITAKRVVGELVFEIEEKIRAKLVEKIGAGPLSEPVKDMKMQFGPMVMGMVEQQPILKVAYDFFKDNVEGIELSFYGAGLFGATSVFNLRGLGALLTFE